MVCKDLNVCIIGSGSIGRRHATILDELDIGKIIFYSDKNNNGSVSVGKKLFPMINNFETAISDADAVFIANPSSLHTPYLLKLIDRDKHVYIEKPVGVDVSDLSLLRAAEGSGRLKIQVGSQFRFNRLLCSLKIKLQEGVLGSVYSVSAYSGEHIEDYPYPNYKSSYAVDPSLGGGVILTQIHQIDYLNWLFGPITRVFAVQNSIDSVELNVETCVCYVLNCQSGLNIICNLNFLRRPKLQNLEIGGSQFNASWNYEASELRIESSIKDQPRSYIEKHPFDRNAMFRGAITNFLDAIKGNAKLGSPLSEGIESLEIACAIKESLLAGEPINIGR